MGSSKNRSGLSIIDDLGVIPLINAGGPNTKNSGSRPRSEAIEAMEAMSEVFVDMDELLLAAGERIAEITGNEAATVTSGASGGLVVQAAAAMAKDDPERIAQLSITAWRAKRANNPARASFYLRPLISRTWLSFF